MNTAATLKKVPCSRNLHANSRTILIEKEFVFVFFHKTETKWQWGLRLGQAEEGSGNLPASLLGAGMCLSKAGSLKLLLRVFTVLTSVSAATGAPLAPIVTVVVVMMELSLFQEKCIICKP